MLGVQKSGGTRGRMANVYIQMELLQPCKPEKIVASQVLGGYTAGKWVENAANAGWRGADDGKGKPLMVSRSSLMPIIIIPALILGALICGCHSGDDLAPVATSRVGSAVGAAVDTADSPPPPPYFPPVGAALGDMDGNGSPSVDDAIRIMRMIVGLDPQYIYADTDSDGFVTVADAIKLLRAIVGLEAWPIGYPEPANQASNLQVQAQAPNILVTWQPPEDTELTVVSYEIARQIDGGGWNVIDVGLGPTDLQYLDTNTIAGTHDYQYRIRVMYVLGQASLYSYSGSLRFTR